MSSIVSYIMVLYYYFIVSLPFILFPRDTTALIKLIKMNVGIGIMAMPTAFYNSGTVFGLVALAAISIVTIHCMHLLVSNKLPIR